MKRKPLKETKLGKFITEKLPQYKDLIGEIPIAGPILEMALDKIKADPEVAPEVKAELIKLRQDHEKEMYSIEVDDRKSAREMYKTDSQLQKFFALTFLAAYVLIIIGILWMIYVIAVQNIHVPDWAIGTISALFGGMSTKVGTITDFLFGSSYRTEAPPEIRLK